MTDKNSLYDMYCQAQGFDYLQQAFDEKKIKKSWEYKLYVVFYYYFSAIEKFKIWLNK